MTNQKEEFYKKWQSVQIDYSSMKEEYEHSQRELLLMTKRKEEFEAKWKNAKETIKEKELEIQKVTSF